MVEKKTKAVEASKKEAGKKKTAVPKKNAREKPVPTSAASSAEKKEEKPIESGKEDSERMVKERKPEKKQPKKVSGKKPYHWVEYKPAEIEQLVVTLANAGHTPSQIGMILRDQHGIPGIKKVMDTTIEEVLAKHNLQGDVPRDLLNLIRKSVELQKHSEVHRKDFTAKRGYQLTISKIRRLVKYYQKSGKLPREWKYSDETAALLVK